MLTEVIVILVIFIELLLGIFALIKNRYELSHQMFFILSSLSAIWTYSNYMSDSIGSLFWFNASYALGALVICSGLAWTIAITEATNYMVKLKYIFLLGMIFSLLSFKNEFIVKFYGLSQINLSSTNYAGWGLYIYAIYYFSFSVLILFKLNTARKNSSHQIKKSQFLYIFFGAAVSLVITFVNSFVLPSYAIFPSAIIDNIGFLFFLIMIAVSITKHQLFNLKIIFLEFIIFGLWIFMFIRIVLLKTLHDQLTEIAVFIIIVVLGTLLIQNVHRVIKQSEEIAQLSNKLKNAYDVFKIIP